MAKERKVEIGKDMGKGGMRNMAVREIKEEGMGR